MSPFCTIYISSSIEGTFNFCPIDKVLFSRLFRSINSCTVVLYFLEIEKYINEILSLENPTRELIINLVEKIYIYQDKTIDIIFTFKNVT